jgi:hypothetical protein
MPIGRGTGRAIAIVALLAIFAVPTVGWISSPYFMPFVRESAWLWMVLVAIVAAASAGRLVRWMRRPRPKKRPTHLKIVRTGETIH